MPDGRTVLVSRMPMKSMWTIFAAQVLHVSEDGAITIRATRAARAFCTIMATAGLVLIAAKSAAGLPWPAVAGGGLLLLMAGAGYSAWWQEVTLFIDQDSGMLVLSKKRPLKVTWDLAYPLSEVAGIQLLGVTFGGALEVIVTTYEVNLVLATPKGKRVLLYNHRSLNTARGTARQIAESLDLPVLDHSDTA